MKEPDRFENPVAKRAAIAAAIGAGVAIPLPYIGPMPSCPRALYALGYGANGITFGAAAARILADTCLGRRNDDAALFRLDR